MKSRTPGPLIGARRRAFQLAIAVLCAGLVLAGCRSGDAPEKPTPLRSGDIAEVPVGEVKDGGQLRIGVDGFPVNFNPVHLDGDGADKILEPTRGNAIKVAADGSWSVDPNYARSVEVTGNDPFTVEVQLEPAARWRKKSPIEAADMIAFVAAMKNDKFEASAHPAFADIDRVDEIDQFAYRVVFKRPNADWPAVIYPELPASVTAKPKRFNNKFINAAPPSNGPFRVTKIDPVAATVLLERNPNWWGETPKLDSIEWRFADAKTLVEAWQLDGLDAFRVTDRNASQVDEESLLRVSSGSTWTQLTLNSGRKPLSDVRVRRAIALALDRSAFAELEQVGGLPLSDVLDTVVRIPGQIGHEALGTETDLKAARKLLKKAGWKTVDGVAVRKNKPLVLSLPVPQREPLALARAELVKAQLAELGIEVRIQSTDPEKFWADRIYALDFALALLGQKASPFNLTATRNLFTPLDGPRNFTGDGGDKLVPAFNKAIGRTDTKKLLKAIPKLEKAIAKQASIVPLTVSPRAMLVRDGLVNFGPTQFGSLDWTKVGWDLADEDAD